MTFNWNYMLSLLSDADFWWATWTVIKLRKLRLSGPQLPI